jgi:hypothetical protein
MKGLNLRKSGWDLSLWDGEGRLKRRSDVTNTLLYDHEYAERVFSMRKNIPPYRKPNGNQSDSTYLR